MPDNNQIVWFKIRVHIKLMIAYAKKIHASNGFRAMDRKKRSLKATILISRWDLGLLLELNVDDPKSLSSQRFL